MLKDYTKTNKDLRMLEADMLKFKKLKILTKHLI